MVKFANDADVMDQALNQLKLRTTLLTVCEGLPAGRTSAITQKGFGGQMLAQKSMTSTQFTLANGDVSGRKLTVAQQTSLPVSATGGGNHVCLVTASSLAYVTTATSQTLTAGNTLTVNAWDIEIADPT